MKAKITLYLLTQSLLSFGQITFMDVLSLENKSFKDIQAFMFKKYTITNDSKEYYYFPINECSPPEFKKDSCEWSCVAPNHLDNLKSKYPIENVVFKKSSNKNYEIWKTLKSTFAENYDSKTNKATTFIYILERTTWANNNCQNKFKKGSGMNIPVNIQIQFSDPYHWENFKSSVAENASFQETWRPSEDAPIEFRYGIRRQIVNEDWKGVFINLYESSSTYHARIIFDSWSVD